MWSLVVVAGCVDTRGKYAKRETSNTQNDAHAKVSLETRDALDFRKCKVKELSGRHSLADEDACVDNRS